MEPEGSSLHRYRGRKLMSFVTAQPESLAAAAGSLAGIGASMSSGSAAAASPTTGVVPAAADEGAARPGAVPPAAGRISGGGGAKAAAIHEQFVSTLGVSSASYLATEAANAA